MRQNKSARECALFLLEYQDRTESDMRRKLLEREYKETEIEEALTFLKAYGYINDADYAARYIRVSSSRKSVRQIRYDLEKRGVSRQIIEECLMDTPVDEDGQIQAFLLKKGYGSEHTVDWAACGKLTGALVRKGFSYESIQRVMDRLCEADRY